MTMNTSILILTLLLAASPAGAADQFRGENPCTSRERWAFGSAVDRDLARNFQDYLKGRLKPVGGLAEGLASRRFAGLPAARIFGEYWIARSLVDAKLDHIAYGALASLGSREVTDEGAEIQAAAIGCLIVLIERHPSMSFPATIAPRLAELRQATEGRASARATIAAAALAQLRELLGRDKIAAAEVDALFELMRGQPAYEQLARGLWSARRSEHRQAWTELQKFLAQPSLPDGLKRYADSARMLAARALYARGEYARAATLLKQIPKGSNELAQSLSELSWTFLMDEKHAEAIGTAMNLQTGGLRGTFAPEAPMVAAMALNELCQYPESVRSVNQFRKQYEKSYRWLNQWSAGKRKGEVADLYDLAIAHLRKQGKTPGRVASEWVRSPVFISSQEELNLVLDEADSAKGFLKSGATEQRRVGQEILQTGRALQARIALARTKSRPGERLPRSTIEEIQDLRRMIAHYRRIGRAAPTFQAILAHQQKQVPATQTRLVARIRQDLEARTERMLGQLDDIAENIQMVEVEIFNGASQDMIWQNAHPDYRLVSAGIKKEERQAQMEKVWDWGRNPASEASGEIWEDELGSFKANLFDNCSSKDKYLAIKKNEVQRALGGTP